MILRSLIYYRQANLAVLLGVAVAASVLTGALLVGDSVRDSLRAMALDRLGRIEYGLLPESMLPADFVARLARNPAISGEDRGLAGMLMLRGTAIAAERRASQLQINGIQPDFARLFEGVKGQDLEAALKRDSGQIFDSALINQALAHELKLSVGDEMVLSFEGISAVHRDSLYGRKETGDVIRKLRVTIKQILPDEGPGSFALSSGQRLPFNVYVNLRALQRALDLSDGLNGIFFYGDQLEEQALQTALSQSMDLAALDARISQSEDWFALGSPSFFLKPILAEAALAVAKEKNIPVFPVSTYLANAVQVGDRTTPYSLIAAADLPNPLATAELGAGLLNSGENGVLFNRWLADDLNASLGTEVSLTWYAVGPEEQLIEEKGSFKLAGILEMSGLAVDGQLAPDFPGIEDAEDMSSWNPPFPMDMSRIREKDETYWDSWRTAPKLLVSLETGRKLWQGRFGYYTTIRFGAAAGMDLEQTRDQFSAALLARLDPATVGLPLVPLRRISLEAASGSTDFSMLFVSFSFFIIAAALLLVGLFFRLSVAGRTSEAGILLAMGYGPGSVRSRFLQEGLWVSLGGAVLGIAGGFAYAWLMMAGLRNWWTMGTTRLYLSLNPLSPAIGFVASVLAGLLAIWLTTRTIGRERVTALISGQKTDQSQKSNKRARIVFILALSLAVLSAIASAFVGVDTGLFFGVGGCLLIAGLAGVALLLRDRRNAKIVRGNWSMAARNTAREASRSLVCVSLVAFACFTIVAVGLSKNNGTIDPDRRDGGAGGFFLEARSDIPLYYPLGSEAAGREYGLSGETRALMDQGTAISMRLRGGDDTSCLNLFAPRKPAILGLPDAGALKDRFALKAIHKSDNAWSLLEEPLEDGSIPAVADLNSAMWILKSGLGKDFTITDSSGRPRNLRFVGLVPKGIFQSEIIISEKNFIELFPDEAGYRFFLLENSSPQRDSLVDALESALGEYGFDATATSEKMARFHQVENTYISIFQLLGGLGLLLGTLGLGAIIYRNALERKGEFAVMRASGFRRRLLATLLFSENAVLILAGIGIGALSALIAVFPYLLQSRTQPSVPAVVLTLVGVFIVGSLVGLRAVARVHKMPLLDALRGK